MQFKNNFQKLNYYLLFGMDLYGFVWILKTSFVKK